MRVLHYNLGLPPYRSGGLTAWSMDLIKSQKARGIDAVLLFPGRIKLLGSKISVRKSADYNDMAVFELINPLPVPLIYGIDSTRQYTQYNNKIDFSKFFEEANVDVIHLHTLMGLPLEFLQQAKNEGIRIVYTTHDTFGVWPEPNLAGSIENMDAIFDDGFIGNQKVLKYSSVVIAQSPVYRRLKTSALFLAIKKVLRNSTLILGGGHTVGKYSGLKNQSLYAQLRKKYTPYFEAIDAFHYNSELTRTIFESYDVAGPGIVSNVYHSSIARTPIASKAHSGAGLKILYNGTKEKYKGFDLLIDTLDEIYSEGHSNFTLVVHGAELMDKAYVDMRPPYRVQDIQKVYADIDVTLVPSLYYETFGMVVAESLSYGVPVVLSRTVGSQSLVGGGENGYIFGSKLELKNYLIELIENPDKINQQKSSIANSQNLIFDIEKMHREVETLYVKGYEL